MRPIVKCPCAYASNAGHDRDNLTAAHDRGIEASLLVLPCVRVVFALVAQWIEHGSPKAGVGGSIPLWGTIEKVRPSSTNTAGPHYCFIRDMRELIG